ncbi:MAG: hypothetical protein GEU93_08830 [Propionibacteriales bacterium]|nr:hypothetical protein [Propionibacteriales bacterium]
MGNRSAGPALVTAVTALATVTVPGCSQASPVPEGAGQELSGRVVATYDAFDATQSVAVDQWFFYAVDNRSITKHDRATGTPLLRFAERPDGPITHLDSGVVVDGRLYAAHSNYPEWPMESSIEVFDTRTMRHVASHSLGINRGSLTWLDFHDGAWWAGFANYDREMPRAGGETEPYGHTHNTRVVRMSENFRVVQSCTIPEGVLDRFGDMSNSGGSWGPDGRLWLTGHDRPEAYVMEIPATGSELEWIATTDLPEIQGQGIAWEGTEAPSALWGISRRDSQVIRYDVPL